MQFLYQIVWTNVLALIFFTSSYYKFDMKRHMGTNSLYPIFTDKQPELNSPRNCKLEKLFLIARHGTRYPEDDDIDKFDVLEKVFHDVPGRKKHKWENKFTLSQDALLYFRGQKEHYLLGKRSFKKYQKFWKKVIPYDPYIIEFRSTKTSRTGMSGNSYSVGLFDGHGILGRGDTQPIYIYTTSLSKDYELAIHRSCPLWKDTVNDNNKILGKQVSQFTSTNLTEITNRISKKYKVKNLQPIHADYIYKACAFDIIFFNEHNSWCKLLRKKDILTLEYFNDMKNYYRFSYGNDLNKRLACKLITKLVNSVEKYMNGTSPVKAELFFTHSETLSFLYTILGLYKDSKPLIANVTLDEVSDRKYKSSEICPFAANAYFEIYNCANCASNENLFEKKEKSILVQIIINEVPVIIPGCDEKYCEWSKFKELMGDNIGCDFKEICKTEKY
ncbi:phosphoglycerate mutase-like protein [Rhizophagus irregularis]|uniref:Multiple inositol polyphosphate phosphatase 1 n=3 Tax=Rhizophagus irregularis TaxID=588596 RepID=U9TNV8_RHIID|nr:histidine phosphatase superfamily [Rhizophagus irregularis DAOM 181602=DAOM 197198]EXX68212.1 Pho11p [Rhizophagus irregularis DAOM 197198w]PKC00669.1 phosphoglycerate mutase-like protein [Rhizophagus irregularis]PKC68936.1 phosphoglycerate mutase-like protein [Rhizophagus irregularis]PKK68194.1 phosphoglycerate mutase-like protein [Rhizophagus irregularis]PKY17940.1 phosphoglycerate mutase-like protein [Rhizophagus irregularis]|eukprot:XP_025166203.1 histidine phosphatase superfamily [Rhizophagus irregularis DAOM 181602=DAOM 197198]